MSNITLILVNFIASFIFAYDNEFWIKVLLIRPKKTHVYRLKIQEYLEKRPNISWGKISGSRRENHLGLNLI